MLKKYFIFFYFFNFTCITFAQDKSIKMKPVINLEIAKLWPMPVKVIKRRQDIDLLI